VAKVADKYFETHPWKIIERGFNPSYSRVSEAIFALSNESLGLRGYFDEDEEGLDSLRGSYINGVYEYEDLQNSYKGIINRRHFMIPTVDWLKTKIKVDGKRLNLAINKFENFTRILDMEAGTLERSFVWRTKTGKALKITFLRFLDMLHPERAYQRLTLEALNFSGEIELETGLSFHLEHEMKEENFWNPVRRSTGDNSCAIQCRTTYSGQEVFAAAQVSVSVPVTTQGMEHGRLVKLGVSLPVDQGKPIEIDKSVVVLFDETERDELWLSGQKLFEKAQAVSLGEALAAQRKYWKEHWSTSDIQIMSADDSVRECVEQEQQGIRFCIFQMAQTYRGGHEKHNIGAKGLTGEAYNGHAFWDTEACCLPFYLFTNPIAAKSLLMFRYNTLGQAKKRSRMLDCEGACYPVATLNGEEACNLWQHASLQPQPSTAVAYGIWHYVHLTGDVDFLWEYGAEMLIEISRYLKSRANQNPKTKKYGYYGVMGPDEFKLMVNNNAYTNYMGMRSLQYAVEALAMMQREKPARYEDLTIKTELTPEEIAVWQEYADNMYIPRTEEGLIEQNDGFFELPHTDINAIHMSEFPLYSNWSYDRIYRTDMIKQPDVLMLLYLYNSTFSLEEKRVNYEYYEPRTIHESSLSPSIHSVLACELSKMDEAVKFFGYATRLDLDNYNRNTREGLHTTSIAMAWINIVYGFGGLRSDGDVLAFAPRMPERWGEVKFSLTYKERLIGVSIQKDKTKFSLRYGDPLDLQIYGNPYVLNKKGIEVATSQ